MEEIEVCRLFKLFPVKYCRTPTCWQHKPLTCFDQSMTEGGVSAGVDVNLISCKLGAGVKLYGVFRTNVCLFFTDEFYYQNTVYNIQWL